jgi:hypothetical protein
MALTDGKPNNVTMAYHWARMIEVLHSRGEDRRPAERSGPAGRRPPGQGRAARGGVGVIEAPRGTLFHHYRVDENDQVTMCNLIVSTTNNNEPMNRAVQGGEGASLGNRRRSPRAAQPRGGRDPRLRSVPVLRDARAGADAAPRLRVRSLAGVFQKPIHTGTLLKVLAKKLPAE